MWKQLYLVFVITMGHSVSFMIKKEKSNHCWLQESIQLLRALGHLHEGGISFFVLFYRTVLRIKGAYGQIISTPVNGPRTGLPSKDGYLEKKQ